MSTLVAFDRRLVDGTTYRVECDGVAVDQFESSESRRCTITLLTARPFYLLPVDPDVVPQPARPVEAAIAADEPRPEWRAARWEDIVAIEPGNYLVRYGRATIALVLGPWED